ncbi:MAG TPA: hypothetical protein PKL17_12460 [Pseudomonadota bacterium]|nr:hypothetical protein [Pseudomonadota bacterium]HNN52282.1 hypothetical protein [Pseudomonadota bacterium]
MSSCAKSVFRRVSALSVLWLLPLLLSVASCDLLDSLAQNAENPPTVQASALQLTKRPSVTQLAAYYCPTVITDSTLRLLCTVTLGSPPPASQLTFNFGIHLLITNPNNVPVPALDVLLALRLFDGQQAEALGAICLSMCGSADPTCTGQPKPGACTSSQTDIRTLNDFQARIPQLITDLVTGKAEQELRKSTIAAAGNVNLDLVFVLGLDQALSVFQKVAVSFVTDLLNGKNPTLSVPVEAEGSVFFELQPVGRFGVGYGPLRTTWNIDSTILN